jgi:hypothetical protein
MRFVSAPNAHVLEDYLLRVCRGGQLGFASEHKFGKAIINDSVEGDIWDGNTNGNINYVYQISAITHYLSSSADNVTDRNAPITIIGVDTNGNYQTEVVILDGTNSQTQVATANTYFRIFRMFHSGSSGGLAGTPPLTGDIYASSINGDTLGGVPQTAANIKAKIIAGEEQTLMGLYTIPNGFTGFLLNFRFDTISGKSQTARIRVREFNAITGGLGSFRTQDFFDQALSQISLDLKLPPPIPSRSDFKITGQLDGPPASSVSGIFEILLVHNHWVTPQSFDKSVLSE